jgi:glycine/D-amino acid oxidase-like deaminating enzyme/nitrite reductase/ring-hydroxylating ferredoxin subunit
MTQPIKSLWTATTAATDYPELKGDIEVDVAVVGGGIAGINAAYFLALDGKRVAVIESSRIASGTSGNTTAKITSQHSLKYAFLKKYFGIESAKIYGDSNQWAIEEFERIIREEKIDCDFTRTSAYVYALTKKELDGIKKEAEVCREIGLPVSFVKTVDFVPFPIKGAIKFENQAYFHPRKYLLALAEKLRSRGNYIFENTKALDIKYEDLLAVITGKGKIRAKKIVVATNYPFFDKGLFFIRESRHRSYAMAAKPTAALPEGMFINPGPKVLSFRPHKSGNDEWLIIGGEGHPSGEQGKGDHILNLLKIAEEKFKIKSMEYVWTAEDSMPVDRVPFIGRMPRAKNIYVTTGYGKWGITTSIVSAKIISDLIARRENKWAELYNPSRFKFLASLPNLLDLFFRAGKNYFRRLFKAGKIDISSLKPEEGKSGIFQGKRAAVYKDKNGNIKAHSAVCTHMGCMVNWNGEEKTWDCPCHGSRFSRDGKVINGPAERPLPEININNLNN